MSDSELFAKFKELTPYKDEDVIFYIHNSYEAIRIRLSDEYTELVFTYSNDKEWRLETLNSYLYSLGRE